MSLENVARQLFEERRYGSKKIFHQNISTVNRLLAEERKPKITKAEQKFLAALNKEIALGGAITASDVESHYRTKDWPEMKKAMASLEKKGVISVSPEGYIE